MSESFSIDRRGLLSVALVATVRPGWADDEAVSAGQPMQLSQLVPRQGESSGDVSEALVAALRRASTERRPLLVDGRFSIRHDLSVPGPVRIIGRPGREDGFDLLPAPASISGGIHGHLMLDSARSIDGVSIEDLTFRGGFDSSRYAGSPVVPIVRTSPRSGVIHKNIAVRRCHFVDPVTDCVHVAPEMGGRVEGLQIDDCTVDVTVPLDRASRSANLVRTILAHLDWAGHRDSYGKIAIQGVSVQRCRARGIRTLADLKRGTAGFEVADCKTEDMSDCHHSADGAFHGVFARVDGVQGSPLIKAKNFIEVQGEDIEIRDFSYLGSSALGAIAGVMITPYAFPVEGKGAGHQSRRIRILNGKIAGIGSHAAIRLINASDCEVRGVVVDDLKGTAVAVENPSGSLTPSNVTIEDIKTSKGRGSAGVFIAPTARSVRVRRVTGFEQVTTGGGRAEP